MIKTGNKSMLWIIISAVLIITPVSSVSAEVDNDKGQEEIKNNSHSNSHIKGLEIARMKLKSAIDNYNNGDLDASKRDMEVAIHWINIASINSKTEKSREESRQLAVKIDAFKKKLEPSSEENENSLIRFLHQASAIFGREIDHLVHSYVDLATSEKVLKHLLDAKMHLYTAEHDLLVYHDIEDSEHELDKVIGSLEKANQVDNNPLQNEITDLSKKIYSLKEKAKESQKAWVTNEEAIFLSRAQENLDAAKGKASSKIKLRIETIQAEIQALQIDIQRTNIKTNYESVMAELKNLIHKL